MPAAFSRLAVVVFAWLVVSVAAGAVETIRSSAELRSMPPTVAAQGLPSEIRGVVTFAFPSGGVQNFIFEQDGISIFINSPSNSSEQVTFLDASGGMLTTDARQEVIPGREIVVSGHSSAGLYAPVLQARQIQLLGHKTLPPARPFVLSEVLSGSMDCQRLLFTGVIQGAEMVAGPPSTLRLELAVQGGRMVVECVPPGSWTPAKLLGATVRMTAVTMTYFNVRGEILGVHLLVGRSEDIAVLKPAPADPFAVPRVPLDRLQPFSPSGPNLERVQIGGQVTLSRPGAFLYLEEGGRAVRVFTRDQTRYHPGDWVVASGFIDLHQSFAELREAIVRRTTEGFLQPPPLLTHKGILSASERVWGMAAPVDYNGRLIRLRGSIAKVEPLTGGSRRVLLATDAGSVAATLDSEGGGQSLDDLIPGSEVQVYGVCELQFPSAQLLTDFPNPTGLSLLMRSADDLKIRSPATWWTPRRQWILIGSTSGLLALALVWNVMLRRLVKKRSSQLAAETRARDRAEIEFDATLRERTRLAADLHDTLEQALTGLAFQLDTSKVLSAKAPETSARHLELGRQLLTRSREDLRRSIWNLRACALDSNSFAGAVRAAALQAAEGRPINIRVEEQGEPCALPEFIAGNLLLLAQEAMTNAIKHGQPETIEVRVQYAGEWINLSVRDDGAGFNPQRAPGLYEGHFGLQGMRERANRLDGTVEIESRPGKGATISVRVPLSTHPARSLDKMETAGNCLEL